MRPTETLNSTELKESLNSPASELSPSPCATSDMINSASAVSDSSTEKSVSAEDPAKDRETIKALLAEARNTKEVLEDFQIEIQNGTFKGHAMITLAKGLSFLGAVIAQNKAHVDNLQARLKPSEK